MRPYVLTLGGSVKARTVVLVIDKFFGFEY